jgi:hypothetical protein
VSKLEVPIRKKKERWEHAKGRGKQRKSRNREKFFLNGDLGHLALHDMLIHTKSFFILHCHQWCIATLARCSVQSSYEYVILFIICGDIWIGV